MRWMNRGTAVSQNEGSIGNMPVTRYEVNPDYGLTEKQVQEYKSAGWGNVEVSTPVRTKKEIVHDNIFTYFNLIFKEKFELKKNNTCVILTTFFISPI